MVRLFSSAVVTALIFGIAQATPVEKINSQEPVHPIGLDPDYVKKQSNLRVRPGPIPKEIMITEEEYNAQPANQTEPIIISDEELQKLQKRYINGADDRVLHDRSTTLPIGKIQFTDGAWCTGTLVGPRTVLTAKHCALQGAGKFLPAFDQGKSVFTANIASYVAGSNPVDYSSCGTETDWAVLILDAPLSHFVDTFAVKMAEKSKATQSIFTHVGYPGDKESGTRPYRQNGNPVVHGDINGFWDGMSWGCTTYGPYYTWTDVAGGQSGGPHYETTGSISAIWGVFR